MFLNTQDNAGIHEDSLGSRQETANTDRLPSAAPEKKVGEVSRECSSNLLHSHPKTLISNPAALYENVIRSAKVSAQEDL